MPRQRMIKPEFFDSGSLAQVSMSARYTFIGLWVMADDFGLLKYQILKLRQQIFPYDNLTDFEFEQLLMELEDVGCIFGYEIEGERYICIPNFGIYQKVNRPSVSTIPAPEKITNKHQIREWKTTHAPSNEHSLNTHGTLIVNEHSVSTHPKVSKEVSREEETYLKVSSSSQVEGGSFAEADKSAPLPPDYEIFNEVDKQLAEWEAQATPCPENILEGVGNANR